MQEAFLAYVTAFSRRKKVHGAHFYFLAASGQPSPLKVKLAC
jgi:hypothetical protein